MLNHNQFDVTDFDLRKVAIPEADQHPGRRAVLEIAFVTGGETRALYLYTDSPDVFSKSALTPRPA